MSSERDQLLSSSTVREGYFKLLDHSVYIPKYHKRLQLNANSPTLSINRKSPSIGRNHLLREGSKTTIISHGATTKASNLNNSVDVIDLKQIPEASQIEGRELDKRALMQILQRNQKKYKPKGASKSKSPFLMSNSISRQIYSTYRKAMQEKLREHDSLSPEILTEALLTGVINPNSAQHSKDNATKKYTLPQFEKLMKNLRSASHAKSNSLRSPKRGIFKFTNFTTPRHSSLAPPSLQFLSPMNQSEKKRHSILIESPSSRVMQYDNKAPDIVENFVKTPEPQRAYILEPTIEGESQNHSDSQASATFPQAGLSTQRAGNKELVVDTLNLNHLQMNDSSDEDRPSSKLSVKILGTRQIKYPAASPGFTEQRLNFFNLTGLNFTENQVGPSQKKYLQQMKNKSLTFAQQQQLSKDYLEAVKRDNLQELNKFQRRYRQLMSQLMSSQNMASPLNKPRGYLNQSLASTRECPQNKSIFEDLVKDSFHYKLKKKRLAQIQSLKERDLSPIITRVDSSLELPKLSAKSAHFHFSALLHQHLTAIKINQDYALRRLKEEGDSSKLSPEIFGYPVTLLRLRKLNSAQVLRELIFHPVFIKFLRTYQIFYQHKENPRMVVVEAQRIVKSQIERLQAQLQELQTLREDGSNDSYVESTVPRSSHRPSVFGGATHYGKGSGDSAFEYSMTKEEQRRQAQFMKLSDIIAKCSIGDSKSKEDLKEDKGEQKVPHSMLSDIVIPRLGEKDKELLFMAALSFLYERHMPEGGWRAMNRVPLQDEELVKVRLDQIPTIPVPKRFKTKIAKQEGDERPFREKHKQGGLGAKTYKSQLPSLAKILYPHIHRQSPRSKRKS